MSLQTKLRNIEQQLEQARDQLEEEEEAKKNLEKQVSTTTIKIKSFDRNTYKNPKNFRILIFLSYFLRY